MRVDSWVIWIGLSLKSRNKTKQYIFQFCCIFSPPRTISTTPKFQSVSPEPTLSLLPPLKFYKSYFQISKSQHDIIVRLGKMKGGGTCSARHLNQRRHGEGQMRLTIARPSVRWYFNAESWLAGALVGQILVKSRCKTCLVGKSWKSRVRVVGGGGFLGPNNNRRWGKREGN